MRIFVLFGLVCRRVSDAVREKLGDASQPLCLSKEIRHRWVCRYQAQIPLGALRLVRLHLLAAVMKNKDQVCSSWLTGKLVWSRTSTRLHFIFQDP